jgi:GNAT superfamily N-acetyltransferase
MFTDAALAARIDRVEARLSRAVGGVIPDALVHELSGGVSVVSRPGSPINKLIGLGFTGPLDLEILTDHRIHLARPRRAVRVELSSLADPGVAEQLSARGYRLRGFEHVLVRPLTPGDADREPGHRLSAATPPGCSCSSTASPAPDGTGVPIDALRPRRHRRRHDRLRAAPGFRRYTARIASTSVGAAAMRIDDRIALLCGASTLPPARRRGVQAALLAARLRDASRAGCELAVVTTEPGSLSQHNVARHGFTMAYARAILVHADPPT